MIRTIVVACLLSALSALPNPALARAYNGPGVERAEDAGLVQPRPGAPQEATLDSDRDGTVSRGEATAHYGWMFAFLDDDHDGDIKAAEFIEVLGNHRAEPARRRAHRTRLEELFRRLDADGDRKIDREEFLAACGAHFSTSDSDGDGEVSVQEFRSRRPL